MDKPAVRRLRGLALLVFVGCSPPVSEQTRAPPADSANIGKRVQAIQAEAKRIDAANEAPEAAERQRLAKQLPHWQFSGLFENAKPTFLSALFSQGRSVRLETYYLRGGKLLLVRIQQWWDVDDARRAPGPATRQDFYIDDGSSIRHVVEVASSPPVTRVDDASRPAGAFAQRSGLIARILAGTATDAAALALEAFPDAEVSK